MASFRKVCESLNDYWDGKKDHKGLDEKAMSVILRGLEIRPDRTDGNTFWDDFVAVLGNNSEGAAQLLGVKSDVVTGWSSKIKKAVQQAREETASDDKRASMVKTGPD